MTSQEIRQKYLDFFKARGHKIISSFSLIPENDPSLLFVNSGMFPLAPYLLGEKHPAGKRLADSQKSFRAEDIDEVGDSRHNTFFEMLGNWSLGDYFKEEQLNWWFEFILDELKLDPSQIYQTVYAGDGVVSKDEDSIQILKNIFSKYGIEAKEGPTTLGKGSDGPGMPVDFNTQRIFAYRDKNWWQRGDAVGELGGPDSETFYDTGKEHNPKYGKHCHVNCDCGRFLEIGNSVFMQYQKTETDWKELANKNVDFGGGLERIAMVVQNKNSIFETDLFRNIIGKIEELSGKKYGDNTKAFEVIADHLKAATFIMGDDKGVYPSNVEQGYIVRRLIRRAIRYGRQLGIKSPYWLNGIADVVMKDYEKVYSEFGKGKNQQFITEELATEYDKFSKTLERGLKEFGKNITINSETLFYLFQTYGFPLEMSLEELRNRGVKVDERKISREFQIEFKKHQELSRTASSGKFKGGLADVSEQTTKYHTATHLLNVALRKVLGEHVYQKGSNITAERLRFDFSHSEKMTEEQLKKVEEMVNEQIQKNISVIMEEMTVEQAKEQGAIGVFEAKYGDRVKVYTIANSAKTEPPFSREICGGPHVENTGVLGRFKIIKQEASSAGVRRIKAILE